MSPAVMIRASTGFLDASGLDAIGADPDALGLAVLQTPDPLQIRIPALFGLVVGMADVVAHYRFFAANLTNFSHGRISLQSRSTPATVYFSLSRPNRELAVQRVGSSSWNR